MASRGVVFLSVSADVFISAEWLHPQWLSFPISQHTGGEGVGGHVILRASLSKDYKSHSTIKIYVAILYSTTRHTTNCSAKLDTLFVQTIHLRTRKEVCSTLRSFRSRLAAWSNTKIYCSIAVFLTYTFNKVHWYHWSL